jgi:hypothetical protein
MLLPDIGDDGDGGSVCMTDSSYTAEESLWTPPPQRLYILDG